MQIRFKQCLSGADFCRNPGDIADVADDQAARLIAADIAEPVKTPEQLEKATLDVAPLETTSKK